jgi:hypothetical protein
MKNVAKQFEMMFIPSQKNLWRPHILRFRNLLTLLVILLVIKFMVFSWLYYFPKTTHFAIVTSSELIEMTNKDRIANGLKPLSLSPQLVEAAQKKALDMLNKDYFAHTSPSGLTPWYWLDKVGYKYSTAGENLAKDFLESEYVHDAWMDSPSHRANILNKNYQDIGIAVVEGDINGQKTILAVEFFGKGYVVATAKTTTPVKKTTNNIANEATKNNNKIELPVSTQNVKGEETSLKGPEVFKQREVSQTIEEPKTVAGFVAENSESWTQKVYLMVLGIIGLVLMLTIFINIKVQYPKTILTALIFIVLIATIMLFNGGALLNRGLEII